jgi:hypothetical protein
MFASEILYWLLSDKTFFSIFLCLGVGKSCLLLRFSDGSFTTSFITTIGLVFLLLGGLFTAHSVILYQVEAKTPPLLPYTNSYHLFV